MSSPTKKVTPGFLQYLQPEYKDQGDPSALLGEILVLLSQNLRALFLFFEMWSPKEVMLSLNLTEENSREKNACLCSCGGKSFLHLWPSPSSTANSAWTGLTQVLATIPSPLALGIWDVMQRSALTHHSARLPPTESCLPFNTTQGEWESAENKACLLQIRERCLLVKNTFVTGPPGVISYLGKCPCDDQNGGDTSSNPCFSWLATWENS